MPVVSFGTGRPDYTQLAQRSAPMTSRGDQAPFVITFNFTIPTGYYVAVSWDLSPYTETVTDADGNVTTRDVQVDLIAVKKVFMQADGNGMIALQLFYPYPTAFLIKYGYETIESWFPSFQMAGTGYLVAFIFNYGGTTHTIRLEVHGVYEVTPAQSRELTNLGLRL